MHRTRSPRLAQFSSVTSTVSHRVTELVSGEKAVQDPTPWFEAQAGYVNSLGQCAPPALLPARSCQVLFSACLCQAAIGDAVAK